MRAFGRFLLILLALYVLSWASHDLAIRVGETGHRVPVPPETVGSLLGDAFGMLGVLLFGILAIPYVIVHSMIPQDAWLVFWWTIVALVFMWLGRNQAAPTNGH